MEKRKVTWSKQATVEFRAAIKYIRQDSEQNVDKVKESILNKINALADDSVVYRKDSYKNNNDGNYLYFELLRLRIVIMQSRKKYL